MLTDTHAHIHFDEFADSLETVFGNCRQAQVDTVITVGVDSADSQKALDFVTNSHTQELAGNIRLFATAGLHPHEANQGQAALYGIRDLFQAEGAGKLVAVGECGLDYYKNFSTKAEQRYALEFQLGLAAELGLPLVFHVRDAWTDFFAILKGYAGIRGVVHSFTGTVAEVEQATDHNLYFGLNGIMTFTKDAAQLKAAQAIPADKLLLETDCPFLSPVPLRGKRNEPANLRYIADFLASLRQESAQDFVKSCSHNTHTLFTLKT